jgi:hypothetical protein
MKSARCRLPIHWLLLVALLAGAPENRAADGSGAPATQRSIIITLVDANSGTPIAGGLVRCTPSAWNDASPKTDQDGKTTVALPKGMILSRFSIIANAPPYVPHEAQWTSFNGKALETVPPQLTLKLTRAITIGGLIKDTSGRPLSSCLVVSGAEVILPPVKPGETTFTERDVTTYSSTRGETVTDSRGFWTQAGHAPGLERLWLTVRRPGGGIVQFAVRDSLNGETEGVPELSADALRATNAVLTLPEGSTQRGLVVDEKGQPISGVVLREEPVQHTILAPTWQFTNAADGRFELIHRVIPFSRITAEAPGRALATIDVSSPNPPDLRLVLAPAVPVRLQLLTPKGEPAAGVQLMPHEFRMRRHLLNWTGTTDRDGRVVWSNAPLDTVVLRALGTKYPPRVIRIDPQQRDIVARLREDFGDLSASLKIRAVDAQSGQAVSEFDVQRADGWGGNYRPWGKASSDGIFHSASNAMLGTLNPASLKIRAMGYRDGLLKHVYSEDGMQEFTVPLTKLKARRGVVVQPDGTPAAQASILINTSEEVQVLGENETSLSPGREGLERARAAADGSFDLPRTDDEHHVLLLHPAGYASLHARDWPTSNRFVLQPWGRIEGSLRGAGIGPGSETLLLRYPLDERLSDHFTFIRQASTRQNGRFTFTNLMAGEYLLYRPQRAFSGLVHEEYYRLAVVIRAGETNHLEYRLGGRTVVGQLFAMAPADWTVDRYTLRRKLAAPPKRRPPTLLEPEEFREANRAFARSPESIAYERQRQNFQLYVDANGSFRATDVPPGDYELLGDVTRSPSNNTGSRTYRFSDREVLGTLHANVVVPPGGDGSDFDLGLFEVPLTNFSARAASPPLAMSCVTLDGKPFELASIRGKPALVFFWAAWAPESQPQLAELGRLHAQLNETQAALISVNLDEHPATAERELRGLPLDGWNHVRLVGKPRAELTERLAINTLPVLLLLSPDGAVVNRGLPAARVPDLLRRLMPASPNK